jgi:ankyrin repeat protein
VPCISFNLQSIARFSLAEAHLWQAAQNGDLPRIKQLIEVNDNQLTDLDSFGATALHWAALNDRVEIAEWILDHGGMETVNWKAGSTEGAPAHWAAKFVDSCFCFATKRFVDSVKADDGSPNTTQ